MSSTATFTVLKKELLQNLKQLVMIEKSSKKYSSVLEIAIIEDFIQLVIPGVHLQISATTTGSAKFTISLSYFTKIVQPEKTKDIHFRFKRQ